MDEPPDLIESEDEGLEDAYTLEANNVDQSPEQKQETGDKLADNANEDKTTEKIETENDEK